jgi:peptidoglycan/xylan/chitin deacetylase (PgdA/CDA1 family)
MKKSVIIRKLVSYPLFLYYKAEKAFYGKEEDRFLILMYHRINRKNTSGTILQDGMYVDPETFQKQIVCLKNNFTIVSLDQVPEIDKYDRKKQKPYCILTFDDGWEDFYEYAYPVLLSNNVCATVFLPTDYIGTTKRFWTDQFSDIIYKIGRIKKTGYTVNRSSIGMIDNIERTDKSIDDLFEESVKTMKYLPGEEVEEILCQLKERWNLQTEEGKTDFLSWGQVKEMYTSGLVQYGSHTKSHRLLTEVTEISVRNELLQSKEKLIAEGVVSSTFLPVAYPNGNYNERIVKLAEETGYHLALTTERGWNPFIDQHEERYRLKRIGIHQDMTMTNAMLMCRIYGS